MAGENNNAVAVYWDFENVHASLYDLVHGKDAYGHSRNGSQETLVDVKAVMKYVASVGNVAINRAYGNWQYFARYRDDFNEAGIDLIQLFSRGKNGKNGADIRLALDVVEDINHYSHITHAVIVAGDSDYIGLAQKVKQSGRQIIGIGVRESTNQFWVKCCNEFKYYQTLIGKSEHRLNQRVAPVSESVREGEKLLIDALKRLISQRGENRVPKGQLKGLIMRIDPTFDEANYGCSTFSAFLSEFSDKIVSLENGNGGYVGLKDQIFEKEFCQASTSVLTYLNDRDDVKGAISQQSQTPSLHPLVSA